MIAYASHCQLDQHGRPIAGYINICPQILSDDNYDEEKIYWVKVYQLFFSALIVALATRTPPLLIKKTCYNFPRDSVLEGQTQSEVTVVKQKN